MLYIWALIAFFSAPILLVHFSSWFKQWRNRGLLQPSRSTSACFLLRSVGLFISLCCCGILLVHYNTIIHPFTLADNRHYVFYVFKIVRLYPKVKYFLVPIYASCAWLAMQSLCAVTVREARLEKAITPQNLQIPKQRTTGIEPYFTDSEHKQQQQDPQQNHVSFFVIYMITCAACLVPAPLVEPRYFILPYIVWRLHVTTTSESNALGTRESQNLNFVVKASSNKSLVLWLETSWFLIINITTAAIFLYRGFTWPQEPSNVQRFLW